MTVQQSAGSWKDGVFAFPIRIYYEDTDVGGMTYHPRYITFFERVRTEAIRGTPADVSALFDLPREEGGPLTYVVHGLNITFLRQSTVGDLLTGHCRVTRVRAAAVEIDQWITNEAGEMVAEGHVTAAIIGEDGRPRRWPGQARAVWEQWMKAADAAGK